MRRLPLSAIPLIKWRVRNLAEPESHVVMTDLPTCANCHSFSRDGKTFGLDLDGPRNDKGLYALVPVSQKMTIRNQDVIHWSSFQLNSEASASSPAVKRFGFMSQVSPDGRYVVTSIGPPDNTSKNKEQIHGMAAGLLDRLYSINYKDFRFLQVFYPMRGILAWYDRKEGTMRPLPGADDPQFVQASAFWSPDGKYLIFSRAVARDPFPPGAPKPEYANDPREPQIQYDLYKIPFNEGRGGKAVPIKGASANGMSNNFPKVSPDGKWIVFVQNKNGLLMRPDSRLFIVPFEGGKARLMNCNLSLMNSWHTFSPDGHWLAFSSKARGPFTRLMLTHIDASGNDTPAIIVDNTTAANRAVNIPEFVNVPPDGGLEAINPQATEFYKLVDNAFKLAQGGRVPEAIQVLRSALELDPDDAMAHYNLGTLLVDSGQPQASLEEYRKASTLSPEDSTFAEHYGVSLAANGEWKEAIANLQKAAALESTSATFQFNLGFVTERSGDYAGAVSPLEKAVELSQGKNSRFLAELAKVYDKTGRGCRGRSDRTKGSEPRDTGTRPEARERPAGSASPARAGQFSNQPPIAGAKPSQMGVLRVFPARRNWLPANCVSASEKSAGKCALSLPDMRLRWNVFRHRNTGANSISCDLPRRAGWPLAFIPGDVSSSPGIPAIQISPSSETGNSVFFGWASA